MPWRSWIITGLGHVSAHGQPQHRALERNSDWPSARVLVAFSLVVASRLAGNAGDWPDALRLHGAAERWLSESGNALHGLDAEMSAALDADGRHRLGQDYEPIRLSGDQLSLAEAIDLARRRLSSAAVQK